MPDEAARSGLSEMARMALPVRVRCKAVATRIRTTRLMMVLANFFGARSIEPIDHAGCAW